MNTRLGEAAKQSPNSVTVVYLLSVSFVKSMSDSEYIVTVFSVLHIFVLSGASSALMKLVNIIVFTFDWVVTT